MNIGHIVTITPLHTKGKILAISGNGCWVTLLLLTGEKVTMHKNDLVGGKN